MPIQILIGGKLNERAHESWNREHQTFLSFLLNFQLQFLADKIQTMLLNTELSKHQVFTFLEKPI